ncbi:ribonuclease H-like domain-containing protein, partial [Tanacetum coccineum]
MDLESAQNNALAKLPLLKQGDYDTWRLIIESYIQLQDYALWEIIEDGNSFKPVARTTTNADGTSTSTIPGAVTAEEKIQKKNDLKARSILMMTLPSEHLLTFNQYMDAKTLFEDKANLWFCNHQIRIPNKEDLKWQLALLSMKARKFYQRTGKKIIINGSDTAGYDKTKVECFNCHKMGHFARECRNPRSQENRSRNQDSSRRTVNVEESSSKAMLAIDGAGFDWSFMTEEEVPTNFALMAFLDSEIERLKKEKESNQIIIDNFENDSKSLDKLIGSQIYDNNRKSVGYNAVAPPPTGIFAPPTIDLSNSGLEVFKQPKFEGYGINVNKSVSENSSNEIKKTSGAPIIKDWVFD